MKYMDIAIKLAEKAYEMDEIPVGAVIVKDNKIVSKGYNNRHSKNNVLGHAEVIAILKAQKKLNSWRLTECEMYVTLKPCELCEKIIKEARISKVYYLVDKPLNKKGYNKTEIEKISDYDDNEYLKKLSTFFSNKR